jgi:Tfp pilus assembly protein PilV
MTARRGVALLVLLVSLAVAAAISVSVLRLAALQRRSLEIHQWQAQAEWLAESGLERAAARLAADPAYPGETWTIPAEALGTGGGVAIRVEPVAGQPGRRRIHIEADYSSGRARQTRDATLTLPKGAEP